MKIRLLSTSEQPCRWPIDGGVAPAMLNDVAQRGSYPTTALFVDEENGLNKQAFKLVEGSEVDLPDHAAKSLIEFGYAEAL